MLRTSLTMPLPPSLLLLAAIVAVLVMALLLRWPHAQVLQGAATFIITLAVLVAMMLVWQALWWLMQRWGA